MIQNFVNIMMNNEFVCCVVYLGKKLACTVQHTMKTKELHWLFLPVKLHTKRSMPLLSLATDFPLLIWKHKPISMPETSCHNYGHSFIFKTAYVNTKLKTRVVRILLHFTIFIRVKIVPKLGKSTDYDQILKLVRTDHHDTFMAIPFLHSQEDNGLKS